MREVHQPPNVSSLVKSLRDIGYTLEVAVADLIDNSISANAKHVDMCFVTSDNDPVFSILDDGFGMDFDELMEAMRLATKDPSDQRDRKDLGRFGLGLKTASFSQCKLLTVVSKTKTSIASVAQWDLEKVIKSNQWILNQMEVEELHTDTPLLKEFNDLESGTLVFWSNIDKTSTEEIARKISKIRDHLSMVFNRFISGVNGVDQVSMKLNGIELEFFDPMDKTNPETLFEEPITVEISDKKVCMQACILPSAAKTTKSAFEKNKTSSRYQGCYLYRANRLIAFGTWWNIIKRHDSNNLVRVEIDIGNDQDADWSIAVTKSGFSVTPPNGIRNDLRAVIKSATKVGRGVVGGRKRFIKNKTKTMFWDVVKYGDEDKFGYSINKKHPLYVELIDSINKDQVHLLSIYLNELQKYLPVEDINRSLIHTPHDFDQKNSASINKQDLEDLIEKLKQSGLSKEAVENLLAAEGFDKDLMNYE